MAISTATSMTGLVSIGMPVRNNERTLTHAVRSILRQTYPEWELILIDDGSTDGTLEVARSFKDPRIRIVSDGQVVGLADRLNEAIALSRGAYFARMDGDDVSYPERLERQFAYLQEHPTVDLVGASAVVFNRNGTVLGKRAAPERHADIARRPVRGFPLIHPTYFGRIEFFRRYGYRSDALLCEDQDLLLRASSGDAGRAPLPKAQDQDLLLRAYARSEFANVPEILLGYRESRLDLEKILASRRSFARSLFHELRRQSRPSAAARAVAEQVLKGTVDTLAIATGLNYRLLRHRARPVTPAEQHRWEQVWHSLQEESAPHALQDRVEA